MKKVIVITGATGGMGRDIASSIEEKAILLLAGLDKESLESLQKDLKKQKITSEIMVCDVSKKSDVTALAKKCKELGQFKAMIHTAGVSGSMKDSDSIFKINLIGTQYLMDAFYEISDHSVFINFASMAGHMVPSSFLYNKLLLDPLNPKFLKKISMFTRGHSGYAYAFSKKGVLLITEQAVTKFAQKNSRILSISPGSFWTPMAELEEKNNPEMKVMLDATPIPRYGKPSEITSLVKYMISDDSEYLNGVDVLIDGGITTKMKYNDVLGRKKKPNYKTWAPLIIYFVIFLLLPLFGKLFLSDNLYPDFIKGCLFIYNPITIFITSIMFSKNKINYYLMALPIIFFTISMLLVYNASAISYLVFYAFLALIFDLSLCVTKKRNNKKD